MLLKHFNLREQPFGVTPDPHYLFLIKSHRAALEGLLYGIQSGVGFIALTAEPGMGKTTLLRVVLNQLGNTAKTVFLFQTITSPADLFRALVIDLGEKDPKGTLIDLEMLLNEILLRHNESGQRVVVVLDEAQNLDDSVLEAIRMLSNFETSSHKLLQVILCGQQELAERLAMPELLQLRQRISIFATLKPLTRNETAGYIEHRLKVAGYENSTPLFTPEAVALIAHYGDGIPRNINNICFNSLSVGFTLGKKVIDAQVVRKTIAGLGLEGSKLADPTSDLGWEEETIAEPISNSSLQEATFAESADEPYSQEARVIELNDDPGLHRPRFAEPNDNPDLQEAAFAHATDDIRGQGARFTEPIADREFEEATLAEAADDMVERDTRFAEQIAEPTGDMGWQRARFDNPASDSEPDEDEFEELDPSEERETSPSLRVALIAALLFATALAVAAWYVASSGALQSPLIAQVTAWFKNSPQAKNQPHSQDPTSPDQPASQDPASEGIAQSAQSSIKPQDKAPALAAAPSQDNSSLQSPASSQTRPAYGGISQPPPVFQAAKHGSPGAKLPLSRSVIPKSGVEVVGARQGQSVAGICVERFNGCSPALLNTIVELNPGIKDQDHLQAGQQVFLPHIESRPFQGR